MYVEGQGFEWLEDPKHIAAIIPNRSKIGAKPQSSPRSKDIDRSDPEALDGVARAGGEGLPAGYGYQQHLRIQWALRHAVLCEKAQ